MTYNCIYLKFSVALMCVPTKSITHALAFAFEKIGHFCPVCDIQFIVLDTNKPWCDCVCGTCGLTAEVKSKNINAKNKHISGGKYTAYNKLITKPLLIVVYYSVDNNFIINLRDVVYSSSGCYEVSKGCNGKSTIVIKNSDKMLKSSISFHLIIKSCRRYLMKN